MWGGKEHNRSIIATRIKKYKPQACNEQELGLMDRLLQVDPVQENIPDILKIFKPNFRQQEEKKKQSLNDIFKKLHQGAFDQVYEQNQDLVVYRIVQNPHPNQVPVVLMRLAPQFAEIQKSRVQILQTCILNLLKALQIYLAIAEEKQKHRSNKTNRSVLQSRLEEQSFIEQNRSFIANQYAINNSGIILENQLTVQVREMQAKLQKAEKLHAQQIQQRTTQLLTAQATIEDLNKQLIETKKTKDYQAGYYEGQKKRLEYELDQLKYQTESYSKQKEKYFEEREALRSANFQIKTKLSHVEKENQYNEQSALAVEQALRKLDDYYKEKQSQEEHQFRKNTIEQLVAARKHITSLTVAIQLKEQQLKKQKQEHQFSLQAQQRKMQEKIEQHKKQLEESLQTKYEQNKKQQFQGILIDVEEIYKALIEKEKQSAKEHQQTISNVRKENARLSQQNQQLKKSISQFGLVQQQEQLFNQRIKDLQAAVRQTYLKSNDAMLVSKPNKYSQPPNRSSIDLHNQLGQTFGEIKAKLRASQQKNIDLQSQNRNLQSKLAISQAMLQSTERQLKGLKQAQKNQIKKQKQTIDYKQKSVDNQGKIITLQKQLLALKKTLQSAAFTDSSILTNQYQKKNILIQFIESFVGKTIIKSELKYRYDPITVNFGYHFAKEMYPFVLLFKLAKTNKIMGVFSTSLNMSKSEEVNPKVFIFGLEDKGYKYQKVPKSKCTSSARFTDNILTLGNNEFTIRNNMDLHYFQLFTSIFGDQYFQIKNPEVLLGKTDLIDFKVQYQQMQMHRVYF